VKRHDLNSLTIEPVYGVIASVEGTVPGRDFSYTMHLSTPGGVNETVSGIMPAQGRWPAPMKHRPQPVGTGVFGLRINGVLQMFPIEPPDVGPCDDNGEGV